MKPFEVYGYRGQVIWWREGHSNPLNAQYGGGVNDIGFSSVSARGGRKNSNIDFGVDRKSARTLLRRYSGQLAGEGVEVVLKKIGEEWFVVDMIGRYVS